MCLHGRTGYSVCVCVRPHARDPTLNADDCSSAPVGVSSAIVERSRLSELWSNNSVLSYSINDSNMDTSIITVGLAVKAFLLILE